MEGLLGSILLGLMMFCLCAFCFWLGLKWAAHCYERDDGIDFLKWHRDRDYKWTVQGKPRHGRKDAVTKRFW